MKILFTSLLLVISSYTLWAQNINYESRITQFNGGTCGNDPGINTTEEHTWYGFISDNINTGETSSGCRTLNDNAPSTLNGTFATRNINNTPATQLRARIDAWEDDKGNRCAFENATFFSPNGDDCRAQQNCVFGFNNPLEYQWTSNSPFCDGGNGYNMRLFYQYRYATIDLANATEYSGTTFSTGGNRPFWGSRGNWSIVGSDCATSGTIGNNQSSSFSTQVVCKSQVRFRWRVSSEANRDFLEVWVNGVRRNRISGITSWATITIPLDAGSNTVEWRYVKDGFGSVNEDRGFVDEISFIDATGIINAGSITGNQTLCEGGNPNNLSTTVSGSAFSNALTYQWQYSNNNATWTNIAGATGLSYDPPAGLTQTRYYRRRLTDGCSFTGYTNTVTVTINTNSTAPTIATVGGSICPNSNLTLTAGGGTAGTGSAVAWFTGPNGTGTALGTGNSITVAPNSTTTYYARRQGICNTTGDDSEQVMVREYIYAPLGVSVATNYCTDNTGWNHFYNINDEIIFSLRGDLTGALLNPVITINNNGVFHQTAFNVVGSCLNGYSPGDELFEMPRSWNVNFTGITNGNYDIRYYFPPNEKTDLEIAAANHIANNPACNYNYTYPFPNGFYWFKNVGVAYAAPLFDQPTKLNGTIGNVNGINYAEIVGINSFSGGAGGIRLSPDGSLPVELSSFRGWNNGSSNTLQWTTETELNNNHFELQRSADGQSFEQIAIIAGAGTTTQPKSYLHEDNEPLLGINYYRLRQVDHDGTATLSNVIAIEVAAQQGEQRLFPNPTTGQLVYQFNAIQEEQLTLQVHNTLGQMLHTWTHNAQVGINNKVLDWTAYPAGTYHVTVTNQQGHVIYTQAIIKKTP